MTDPAKPRRTRRITATPQATASVASAILAQGAAGATNEESILDQIDFREELVLFDKDHVKLCRKRFAQTELIDFIAMMRSAKKLNVDPLSDIWTAADGTFLLRAAAMFEYASRTGRYAPGDQPAMFKHDDALKGDDNPEGLISCTVTIRVRAEDGTWHTGYGEAFWRDLVPLTGGQPNPRTGLYEGGWVSDRTGWASMGRTMLRKCAYVDALKKGFPELGTFYIKEEMESVGNQPGTGTSAAPIIRRQPAAAAPAQEANASRNLPTTSVRWANGSVTALPLEEFFDTVVEAFAGYSPEQIVWWFENNLGAREDFWRYDARNGNRNATALKKHHEAALVNDNGTRTRVSQRATPGPSPGQPECVRMMRIYRITNNTRIGPLVFAESETDAIQVAVDAGRVRNPAKAKAADVTDSFAHPRDKTQRAIDAGIKGVAAYRLNSADSPATRLAITMMGSGPNGASEPSGWIINGQFVP